ncbi:MAG TPA: ABC transporter substrate-binding protein [Actinomycetota bacterium]|nr:ABC transporter substrate-binding protein [Actinomycetota bacterium]
MLALLAALALVAAACGGGEEEPSAGPTETGGGGADLSGQSVEVAAVWTGTEQESFQQVLDAFSEQTGADVQYTSTGDDVAAVLGTRVEGGDPPDVAFLPQPGLLRDFVDQDALIAIDDVAGDEVDANYAPVWRELGTVDGTLYGVWFKAANKSTVWYNTNVFGNAGVSAPEDWDGMLETAGTISDFGVTPWSIGGADGWTLTDWFENVYIRTAGPDMYDQLTNHEIPWTDQSVKDALTTLADVFSDKSMIAGNPLQTDFPTSVANVFASPDSPDASIVYEGDFVAGVISGETDSTVGEDADFFTFPSIDGSAPSVVGGGDVAVLMKDSDAGKALMEFLASPEAGQVWAGLGGFTSPNQNVDLGVYPDDITRKSAEALTSAETFRFDLSDLQPAEFGGTVGQGLFKLFQDFLENPDDIDGVTKQMEDAAAKAFG